MKDTPMFITSDPGRNKILAESSRALAKSEPIFRTSALNTYQNIVENNVSIRDSFSRRDYERVRPLDTIPKRPHDIIRVSDEVYENVGLIKNVIDMMADFASQGIDVAHNSLRVEKIYKAWAKRVQMKERSERFLNYFYRHANVIVKRRNAKLKNTDKQKLLRGIGASNIDVDFNNKVEQNVIPWDYVFLNPLSIDVVGEEIAPFLDASNYVLALKVSNSLRRKLQLAKDGYDKNLMSKLPVWLTDAISGNKKEIILDRNQIETFYYKKDDWNVWAKPLVYSILKDIFMLDKMKLADLAALDGAISHIRLWKLGSLEKDIHPTQVAVDKLASMLLNNVGGGSLDLIWGPAIELVETNTEVYKFLGSEKYKPVLDAIYQGLGIPPTLTGSQSGGGFTNNFISLRTLIERLKYGRDALQRFWEKEIKRFQLAMGFRLPAQLVFERMTLTDEATEKALLLQLADRDLISIETLQERFGEIPEIEMMRLKREQKMRDRGILPLKASPWHNPQPEHEYKKIALQAGDITIEQTGTELEPVKPGTSPRIDKQIKSQNKQMKEKSTGVPQQGRPLNSIDKKKRKQKVVKPRSSAVLIDNILIARSMQNKISDIITPIYLKSKKKKTLRNLTEAQFNELENFKFAVQCNCEFGVEVDSEYVKKVISNNLKVVEPIKILTQETLKQFKQKNSRVATIEEIREIQASVIALYNTGG